VCHNQLVPPWSVDLHPEFVPEFEAFPEAVQDELLAHIAVLETFGPQLGRPRVDTLNGSRHKNMKELRFDADNGVWRFAFAVDPKRTAMVLCMATSPAVVSSGSIVNSSRRPTDVSMPTLPT
jgi:hypothetical protein